MLLCIVSRLPVKRRASARGDDEAPRPRTARTDRLPRYLNGYRKRKREKEEKSAAGGDDSSSSESGSSSSTDSDGPEDDPDSDGPDDGDDMDAAAAHAAYLDAAVDELHAMRAMWELEGGVETIDFDIELRGGRWTAKHRNKACDSFRGRCATGSARTWARAYDLPQTFTAAIGPYGEFLASQLCLAWCHRMQWLFDAYKAGGDPGFIYDPDFLLTYQEEETYLDTVLALSIDDPAFDRVMQIRGIRPHAPIGGG